jgi:hypothetical protein
MNNLMAETMSLNEFILYMLDSGKYTVNVDTQEIIGPSGKILKHTIISTGYKAVSMCFSRRVVRQTPLHRIFALIFFGKEACIGKHVAHKDGNKLNNIRDNLILLCPTEHVFYDETHKNLPPGKRKTEWLPCVLCNDPDGQAQGTNITPDRISGRRFNLEGSLCRRCYHKLLERERRKTGGSGIQIFSLGKEEE